MQRRLDHRPQPWPGQQHKRDSGATDYRAQQGDGDEHPAKVDIEHAAPQIKNRQRSNATAAKAQGKAEI